MRGLAELLASPEGRAFLEARGVVASPRAFREMVGGPARRGLHALVGIPEAAPSVYVAHQAMCDYPASVVAKFAALRDLAADGSVAPVVLWQDGDRAGSDAGSTTLWWLPAGDREGCVRFAPHRFRDLESRLVPVAPGDVEKGLGAIRAYARSSGGAREKEDAEARERRAEALAVAVRAEAPRTLADLNVAVGTFLVREHLGYRPAMARVSAVAAAGLFDEPLRRVVESIDDVVLAWNAAVDTLTAADVDAHVHRLGDEYLPLFFSCPRDGLRRRLVHDRTPAARANRGDAVARCRCGAEYRFPLDPGAGGLQELIATGRWSIDVTLPIALDDLAGGVVAGRSSALYGLVLAEVLEKVFGRRAVPVLVPPALPAVLAGDGPTLLQAYLSGS